MLSHLENSDVSQLLKSCPLGLALSDEQHKISWVNSTFENFLGISSEEIQNTDINDLPADLKQLFQSNTTMHVPANDIRGDQWFMCSQSKLKNSGNTMHYFIDVGPLYTSMQEKEQLREELIEVLAIDPITGMPNRKSLFQSLEPQVSRSRRYNNQLSVVIMRLTKLEKLNTDEVSRLLVPVSQMLNDQVRWADIVGRLGESDFLLVLPETSAEACEKLSQNLSKRLESLPVPQGLPNSFKFSAKFGIAEWQKGDDVALLMQKAQQMLNPVN